MKQKHDLAQEDYMKGMKYKELAEKYAVSVNTVKSWNTSYKRNPKDVHTQKKYVHKRRRVHPPAIRMQLVILETIML
ncbi:hypothetical protein [Bacillus thuringiensis]|uniref:hypothetical protein n=1 Tax=Bacillus thuringiensis TaxID=1428 RepID=UPI0030ED8967